MSNKEKVSNDNKQPDELSEDMEVVGPGQMLSEARKKLSLSTEDVATKLNFKKCLVENIERDTFDQKLPATFNRGYLRNYSKLVNIDVDEVLSAYDMLGVAEAQRSEMQSFSNLTEKQAEHSRLMWLSYFIAAILFGLMILWWQQEPKQSVEETKITDQITSAINKVSDTVTPLAALTAQTEHSESSPNSNNELNEVTAPDLDLTEESPTLNTIPELTESADNSTEVLTSELGRTEVENSTLETVVVKLSTAVFTFSGDCWVNIYDATGERIAWGVKKSGYVMTVQGVPPLKITLGKPELAEIVFNELPVDMSGFSAGNIAKFNLPLSL